LNYAVILAGGKGERFWPLSRTKHPKQLLRLISDKTMLQETIDRILPLIPVERILVVSSEDMTGPILNEIDILKPENILAEPMGRNTCLAIGLAAEHLLTRDENPIMAVLSADHIIKPAEKFLEIVKTGAEIAHANDRLITIGIEPSRAETEYGYIKVSRLFKKSGGISIFEVDSFTEKPHPAVAQQYYLGREHLWNSGMFIWSAKAIIEAIGQCKPDIGEQLEEYSGKIGGGDESHARNQLYEKSEPISIDFAVLENAENVLVIRADLVWDDVGSWNALARYKEKDHENNVIIGPAKIVDSYETTVYNNEDEGLIIALGTSDHIIVRTKDVVLVAHKTKVNEVKQIIRELASDEKYKEML